MDRQQKRVLKLRNHVLNQSNNLKENELQELESEENYKLEDLTVKELKDEAKAKEIEGYTNMNKEQLMDAIKSVQIQ